MLQKPPDFPEILKSLQAGGVRFVLIGGLAMRAQGTAHVTDDIDIGYARNSDNYAALATTFLPHEPRLRVAGMPEGLAFPFDARTFNNTLNLTLATDMGNVDLLGEIAGIDSFDGLWERASEIELFGVLVRVASIDDLLSMKRAANRLKDQNHILELEALKKLKQTEGL